jgi:hypothetical protein
MEKRRNQWSSEVPCYKQDFTIGTKLFGFNIYLMLFTVTEEGQLK